MDRLDRKDLKDAAFDVVLRGYDKRQVDERLRFLGAELTAADSALRAVGERAALLEDALNEARSTPAGEPPGDSNSARGSRRSSSWPRTRRGKSAARPMQ